MNSKAIVVGVDAYAVKPLTSAVSDAQEVGKALLRHGLLLPHEVILLTSPATGPNRPATYQEIWDALYDVYLNGDALDRFFFFFAGHGISAYVDAAQTTTHTALLPVDVGDLKRDGRVLIDLHELRDLLEMAGPKEQYFLIDACRDLPYDLLPRLTPLGWSGVKLDAQRAQGTLFAVRPFGQALGAVAGLGVMTAHLLTGLDGEGVALDYDDQLGDHVITLQSMTAHVQRQVKAVIENEPLWQQKYQVPTAEYRGPALEPLRSVTPAPLKPLTVHVDPDAAASTTAIHFTLGNVPIANNYSYPPQQNHTTIQLAPHRYRLHAQTASGTVHPIQLDVDVRLITDATVIVMPSGQTAGPRLPVVPNTGPVIPTVAIDPISNSASVAVSTGRLKALPLEPETAIECEALQPPYTKWVSYGQLDQEVPEGAYRISLRLGLNVFNETEVFVAAGEEANVRPTSAVSPLVEEALGVREEVPTDQVISESIGPIQAAVLPTMLPLIGAKAFDFDNVILSRFTGRLEGP